MHGSGSYLASFCVPKLFIILASPTAHSNSSPARFLKPSAISLPQIAQRCLTMMGTIALETRFYHQLYRLSESGDVHSPETLVELRNAASTRERQIHEMILQLRQRSHTQPSEAPGDLASLAQEPGQNQTHRFI